MSFKVTKTFTFPYDYIYIPKGLCEGSSITVTGKVQEGCRWLAVSLHKEANPDCDIALHFNPRFSSQAVVRNSKVKGVGWKQEEREIAGDFPLKTGDKINLRIWVNKDDFKILLNQSLFTFKHRMPYNDVKYVTIGGNQGDHHAEIYQVDVHNSCKLPFTYPFYEGMKNGTSVKIQGMVNNSPTGQFKVDFNKEQHEEESFCQMVADQNQQQVVINSKLQNVDQEERRPKQFPFKQGEEFESQFMLWEQKMLIFVDGSLFDYYDIKDKPQLISQLAVDGDVTIKTVNLEEPIINSFEKYVPSGLQKNDVIVFKGFFYPRGERFQLNLMYENGDIGLHFNPRRHQGQIVLNTRSGGRWDTEERHSLPLDFEQLKPFQVDIVVKSKKFKMYVHDKWICDFKARGNITDLKRINVEGDAYHHEVSVHNRTNEITSRLPSQLKNGSWISCSGTLKKKMEKFFIQFQGEDKLLEIPFHMEPQIQEQQTVVNSMQQGQWQQQQQIQQEKFPFSKEKTFYFDILLTADGYKVFVDGEFYFEFKHRQPMQSVQTVQVQGDVNMTIPEPLELL